MTEKKNFIKVPTPLTAKELKEKIDSGIPVVTPQVSEKVGAFSHDDSVWDKPEFVHAEMSGIFNYQDEIGIDGNGGEHTFHGGMGVTFRWGAKGIGFGEFTMKLKTNGQLELDTENTGKEFFRAFMNALIDKADERKVDWSKAVKRVQRKPS